MKTQIETEDHGERMLIAFWESFCHDNNYPLTSADELLNNKDIGLMDTNRDIIEKFIDLWDAYV